MKTDFEQFELDDNPARIDFSAVHQWLANSYWSPGVPREKVERAAHYSSILVGVYLVGRQVAYLRVVSDRTTFAYLADVIVDPEYRGKGIGQAMIRFALAHPDHQNLRRWMLATRDAHGFYEQVGFIPLECPGEMMVHRPRSHPRPVEVVQEQ